MAICSDCLHESAATGRTSCQHPRNAREAFDRNMTYRPRTWGIGVNAMKPREEGVEVVEVRSDLQISDAGITVVPVRELVLFHYHTPVGGKARKWAIARKPCPPEGVVDPFRTGYDWVEAPKNREVA